MAIATDAAHGVLGTAVDWPTERLAEQFALENCRSNGGSNCKIGNAYRNSCAVMVVGGDGGFVLNGQATLEAAMENAMAICRKDGDTKCHVYYSACSLPKRVR